MTDAEEKDLEEFLMEFELDDKLDEVFFFVKHFRFRWKLVTHK